MWRKKTRGVELYAKNLSSESRTIVTQGACMKSLVVVKHGCTTTNLRQKIVQCSGVYRWKPPQIAKRNRSQQKVLHTITFNSSGITLYKPREDGSSITGKYYREYTLAEVNSFTTEFDTGTHGIKLCYDNSICTDMHTRAGVFRGREMETASPCLLP